MLKLFFPIPAVFGGPLNSIIEETASSHGVCGYSSTPPEGASCCKGCLEGAEFSRSNVDNRNMSSDHADGHDRAVAV
jgi:hypothetical protein